MSNTSQVLLLSCKCDEVRQCLLADQHVTASDGGHDRIRASGPDADAHRAVMHARAHRALGALALRLLRHDEGGLVDRGPPLVGDIESGLGQGRDKGVESEHLDYRRYQAQTLP